MTFNDDENAVTPEDLQKWQGSLLPLVNLQYFEVQVAALTEVLCNIVFPADPIEKEANLLYYREMQSKRNTYISIIEESKEAHENLARFASLTQ